MRQYNEFIEIFKRDLEAERAKLRLYRSGELRSMSLEADRWCDSTVIAIEQIKRRIAELKARITNMDAKSGR